MYLMMKINKTLKNLLKNIKIENQNSCCFVATIKEVRAIKGADSIELVITGGEM